MCVCEPRRQFESDFSDASHLANKAGYERDTTLGVEGLMGAWVEGWRGEWVEGGSAVAITLALIAFTHGQGASGTGPHRLGKKRWFPGVSPWIVDRHLEVR